MTTPQKRLVMCQPERQLTDAEMQKHTRDDQLAEWANEKPVPMTWKVRRSKGRRRGSSR